MKRHADFDRIYGEFINHFGKEQGDMEYKAWIKDIGADETKPYGKCLESFKWAKELIQKFKEDDDNEYFRVWPAFPLKSMNGNVYTKKELEEAAASLVGKVPTMNHKDKYRLEGAKYIGAKYEDDAVEAILKIPKKLECPIPKINKKVVDMIHDKDIVNVSLEMKPGSGDGKPNKEFDTVTLLTKDVLPGIPLARIRPLETIMREAFEMRTMRKIKVVVEGAEVDGLKVPDPSAPTGSDVVVGQGPPANDKKPVIESLTEDEIKAKIEEIKGKIDKLYRSRPPEPDTNALYAELQAYQDAFTKIVTARILSEHLEKDFNPSADWPDKCFMWVPDSAKGADGKKSDRKLPYMWPDGEISIPNVRNALSRLNQTKEIPADDKDAIKKKAQNILKKDNPDYEPTEALLESMSVPDLEEKCKGLKKKIYELQQGMDWAKPEPAKVAEIDVMNQAYMVYADAYATALRRQINDAKEVADLELENSKLNLRATRAETKGKGLEEQVGILEQTIAEKNNRIIESQAELKAVKTDRDGVLSREKGYLESLKQKDEANNQVKARMEQEKVDLKNAAEKDKETFAKERTELEARLEDAHKQTKAATESRDAYKVLAETAGKDLEKITTSHREMLDKNLTLTRELTKANEDIVAITKKKEALQTSVAKAHRAAKVILKT
jgi:hypothetical protein